MQQTNRFLTIKPNGTIETFFRPDRGRMYYLEQIENMENSKVNLYKKYQCPCCNFYTLEEEPTNTFQICPVCFWEDDGVQFGDPDYAGGANYISLNEARKNFKRIQACDINSIGVVRPPNMTELP